MIPLMSLLLLCLQAPIPTEPTEVELFNGRDLTGWTPLGDAVWTVVDGELLGEVGGGGQSFLASERAFGDFRLELDVRTELPGNSGIQIRSHLLHPDTQKTRLFGYQIEIDPSERAWSGGLYDEARRGWLQNLEGRDAARAAFQPGEWNRSAIECRGAWLRTWIDGGPITDDLDPLDCEGLIGLQVHSGDNTKVRWRNFELTDFGTQAWRPAAELAELAGPLPDPLNLRWTFQPDGPELRLELGELTIATGFAEGQAKVRIGEAVVEQDVKAQREGQRHLAVCRLGQRLRVFLDGQLIHSEDAFAPRESAAVRFGTSDGDPLPSTQLFEQLVPVE